LTDFPYFEALFVLGSNQVVVDVVRQQTPHWVLVENFAKRSFFDHFVHGFLEIVNQLCVVQAGRKSESRRVDGVVEL